MMHRLEAGPQQHVLVLITRAGSFHRAPGSEVHPVGPGDLSQFLRRNQPAVVAVDDIEEAVLCSMQHHPRRVSASTATTDAVYRLSPPPGLRIFQFEGSAFPVPKYSRLSSGSNVMAFQTLPPPPNFHHSPVHVFAARSMISSDAAPSLVPGFPGTR